MQIDFSIDYESERAEFAKGDWQIYLLKNVPTAVGRKDYKRFGEGLGGEDIKGFLIKVM